MKLYYRFYQKIMKGLAHVLPWREPKVIKGKGSVRETATILTQKEITRVLIITDQDLESLGLLDELKSSLKSHAIHYALFDQTVPNPTIDNIETALAVYKQDYCQAIIAFGGGSPIDCAKGVAARVARPKKSIEQMKGLLKVRHKTPLLIAIPTTAGSGSEATIAAVISNPKTHEKYAINDLALMPNVAVLDPELTVNLPAKLTATTGMDALTHAVEAYIGKSNTKKTRLASKNAIKRIHQSLEEVYQNPSNLEARMQMQEAAHEAGIAFTRAYVGYVHAIAHTLGGFYNTPHGLANAVILPHVLTYYGKHVYTPLSELADLLSLTAPSESKQVKAEAFIDWIKALNKTFNIPTTLNAIQEDDITAMVERAYQEAHPLYPVPKILTRHDFHTLYQIISE